MIIELGNSYQMADETIVHIQYKSGTRVPLFRAEITDRDAWFADGTHSSGNDSLKLIARVLGSAPPPAPVPTSAPVAAPVGVRLGRVVVTIDLDAMTASVRRG
jgi:hypothetical protein